VVSDIQVKGHGNILTGIELFFGSEPEAGPEVFNLSIMGTVRIAWTCSYVPFISLGMYLSPVRLGSKDMK
jgi:hypothetical protein